MLMMQTHSTVVDRCLGHGDMGSGLGNQVRSKVNMWEAVVSNLQIR